MESNYKFSQHALGLLIKYFKTLKIFLFSALKLRYCISFQEKYYISLNINQKLFKMQGNFRQTFKRFKILSKKYV